MSHIATALAKMKGKNVAAPPDGAPDAIPSIRVGAPPNPFASPGGQPAESAVAASASRMRRWQWPAIGAGVVAAGLAGAWFFFVRAVPPPTPPLSAENKAVAAPAVNVREVPVAARAPALAAKPAAEAPSVPPPAAPRAQAPGAVQAEPSPALAEKVRRLPIGAEMTGERPRVLIGGRLYTPGDQVADGLVLQQVLPGLLVFRDANGAVYTRRF